MTSYNDFYQRSITEPDAFWREQAGLIEWFSEPTQICDHSNPPFAKWFVGGKTNLCHNAVDRHARDRAEQPAVVFVSTETGQEKTYNFRQLKTEVQCWRLFLRRWALKKAIGSCFTCR
jgi:propionyl-CoA synthetase